MYACSRWAYFVNVEGTAYRRNGVDLRPAEVAPPTASSSAKNGHLSSLWTRVRLTGARRAGAMWRKSSAALPRLQGRRPEVTAISPTGCVHTMPCVTGPGLLPEREAY